MRTLGMSLVLAASAFAVGCSGSSSTTPGGDAASTRATLRRASSCADLEQSLKADALGKMNKAVDAQIRSIRKYGYGGGIALNASVGARGAAEATAGTAAPQAATDASKASSFSETNKQVAGVDEADFVKTDGKYIYLIHGQKLEILNAWPAATLGEASAIDIEGEPTEMFQWEGKVVVYSRVDGAPVYAAAGKKPRSQFQDYAYAGGGMTDAAMPYPGGSGWMSNPLTKITVIDLNGAAGTVSRELYFEGSYLSSRRIAGKVRTVLNGAAPGPVLKGYPETPAIVQQSQTYPTYPAPETPGTPTKGGTPTPTPTPASTPTEAQLKDAWITAYEGLRAENAAKIQASTVTDWVPYTFTKNGGAVESGSIACEDFYLPTPGTTQYGLTHVQTFDATSSASPVHAAAIVGQADTVYANEKTLVLASRGWIGPEIYELLADANVGVTGGGTATVGVAPPPDATSSSGGGTAGGVGTRSLGLQTMPAPIGGVTTLSMNLTHLHKFDIGANPDTALYVASGTVAGNIKDQFSLDERAGAVRVTTTEQRGYAVAKGTTLPPNANLPRTANHVFALEEKGGALVTVGDVGDLAPGESIMSTRFVGDAAYVVTFLQKDPLFVIDMKNPRALSVLGQLTIPGFSSYMHPIDDTHLLTIGRDGGLALQIFDVTNPAAPTQSHKFVYTNDYGYSEAESNHKAFTYFADKKLLAFPFTGYGPTSMKSTLELFKIDAAAGIQRVGAVDHTSFFGNTVNRGYCGGYYEPSVRRGIFLDNVVYSVSYGGVIANDATTLSSLASYTLKAPVLASYPGCGGGVPVEDSPGKPL